LGQHTTAGWRYLCLWLYHSPEAETAYLLDKYIVYIFKYFKQFQIPNNMAENKYLNTGNSYSEELLSTDPTYLTKLQRKKQIQLNKHGKRICWISKTHCKINNKNSEDYEMTVSHDTSNRIGKNAINIQHYDEHLAIKRNTE
jgi:hypothetical protein